MYYKFEFFTYSANMTTFALAGGIIPPEAWESTPAQFPTAEAYNEYLADLKTLQEKYRLRNALCPHNFRGNQFSTELLSKIVDYSRNVTRYLNGENNERYYMFLELFHTIFAKNFTDRIQARYEVIKSKAVGRRKEKLEEVGVKIKGVPLRSFHILDDAGYSVKAFTNVVKYIEAETGSTISWNHLSTYSNRRSPEERIEHVKDSSYWTKGVDGDGCNISNIRAWKNKITTILKTVDIIIINDLGTPSEESSDPLACAIAFVLMNLNADGYAAISLGDFSSAASISMVHLFSKCFERATIIHTIADDNLFLCGSRFKNNIISPHYKHLFTACITPGNSIFSTEYMNGESFTETVESLLNVVRAASEWRLQQYKKLFSVYEELSQSASSKMIKGHVEKVLGDYYPDESARWREAVQYK